MTFIEITSFVIAGQFFSAVIGAKEDSGKV